MQVQPKELKGFAGNRASIAELAQKARNAKSMPVSADDYANARAHPMAEKFRTDHFTGYSSFSIRHGTRARRQGRWGVATGCYLAAVPLFLGSFLVNSATFSMMAVYPQHSLGMRSLAGVREDIVLRRINDVTRELRSFLSTAGRERQITGELTARNALDACAVAGALATDLQKAFKLDVHKTNATEIGRAISCLRHTVHKVEAAFAPKRGSDLG